MSVKKIVLTGGPCAGKSTALSLINEHLNKKGYNVITINESATELINSGIKPFGENKIDSLKFQKIILDYQLMKEKILGNSVFDNGKNTVIIHDRGVMDNKAYLNNEDFDILLKNANLGEVSLLDNYDLVIHLVSASCGAEEFYTLANNNARTETIEEARILDTKTKMAWNGHDDLRIVTNDINFNEKMLKTISIIDSILESNQIKFQNKYLIDLKYLEKSLKNISHNSYLIEQQYLSKQDNLYRLRKKSLNNHSSFNLTLEKLIGNSQKNILETKRIDEKTYLKILKENFDLIRNVKKERICFIYENQCFRIDTLENGLCVLETSNNEKVNLPKFLPIIDEVTDKDYYSYSLSKKMRG